MNPTKRDNEFPSSASKAVTDAEFQKRIQQLRDAGKTISEIAAEFGMTIYAFCRCMAKSCAISPKDAAHRAISLREHDFMITDILLEKFFTETFDGDGEAFKKTMSLLDRRSKCMGLDAPAKATIDLSGGSNVSFLSRDQMIAKIAERAGFLLPLPPSSAN